MLGSDLSGTVEESRADGFAEGDEVFGRAASGAYAEFATASAGRIAKRAASGVHARPTKPEAAR